MCLLDERQAKRRCLDRHESAGASQDVTDDLHEQHTYHSTSFSQKVLLRRAPSPNDSEVRTPILSIPLARDPPNSDHNEANQSIDTGGLNNSAANPTRESFVCFGMVSTSLDRSRAAISVLSLL